MKWTCESTNDSVLVPFPVALTVPWSKQFGEARFLPAPNPRGTPSQQGEHGSRSVRPQTTSCWQSGRREQWVVMLTSLSPFYSVQDEYQLMGCYCPQLRSAPRNLDSPSEACPVACCLGDCRSCHIDWQSVLTITHAHWWAVSQQLVVQTLCTVKKWT